MFPHSVFFHTEAIDSFGKLRFTREAGVSGKWFLKSITMVDVPVSGGYPTQIYGVEITPSSSVTITGTGIRGVPLIPASPALGPSYTFVFDNLDIPLGNQSGKVEFFFRTSTGALVTEGTVVILKIVLQ